jgi:hypothetical protein
MSDEAAAALLLLVQRFPRHEIKLHRHYRQYGEFQLLCDEYFVAVKGFEDWLAAARAIVLRLQKRRAMPDGGPYVSVRKER